jgi:hypothetical protein
MYFGEFINYALNTEEAAVNPGTDAEGNSNNSNVKKTQTTVLKRRGVVKAKVSRNVEVIPLPFLMVKKDQLVIYVGK